MDHYMNYGSEALSYKQFAITVFVTAGLAFVVWCIVQSILNRDIAILDTLR